MLPHLKLTNSVFGWNFSFPLWNFFPPAIYINDKLLPIFDHIFWLTIDLFDKCKINNLIQGWRRQELFITCNQWLAVPPPPATLHQQGPRCRLPKLKTNVSYYFDESTVKLWLKSTLLWIDINICVMQVITWNKIALLTTSTFPHQPFHLPTLKRHAPSLLQFIN